MTPRTLEEARERNEAARAAADADPVAMAERLAALPWLVDRLSEWPDPWTHPDPGRGPIRAGEAIYLPPTVDGPDGPRIHPAWRAEAAATSLAQLRNDVARLVRSPDAFRSSVARHAFEALVDLPEKPDSTSGLSLLAAAVEQLPEDETAVSRPDPILPRIAVRESPERAAGKLAFGIAEPGRGAPGQLPLIEAPDLLRVPLLELCDWHGVPVTQQGGGAPHALAVYVSALLVTPLKHGRGERSIIATVRDLKEHLFPGRWNPARDWPRIREALIAADSLVLPEVYRTPSGFRQPWRAVALRTCPGEVWERGMLNAEIRLAVEHPPNASGDGPILERAELARLRASDGPKYRAYIGGHSLLWRPGVTRVKHRGRWYWTRDRDRYPILTAADRDRIAFASKGERRRLARGVKDAAWEGLSGIRILDRAADTPDGRRGWRIAPDGAGPE